MSRIAEVAQQKMLEVALTNVLKKKLNEPLANLQKEIDTIKKNLKKEVRTIVKEEMKNVLPTN